ncbi:MAG TPA: TetR/AcrR family transcriptional regulator [Acidimicrobiales bacterium]|nr:TetR/AcrR family transcriptional regulator [Acidimicrobiales bacterium]
MSWVERAVDRSPMVQRSRDRGIAQAHVIVRAARQLIAREGSSFTTQELVKEAGVALQTFYRYFASKDQLLLAVFEDMISEFCAALGEQAAAMSDPVERLRHYVTIAVGAQSRAGGDSAGPRFITSEHWRLQQEHPEEIAVAIAPYTELLVTEIEHAVASGALHTDDPRGAAWMITQLVMAVFHHYAFAPAGGTGEDVAEGLWRFCLTGLGVPA